MISYDNYLNRIQKIAKFKNIVHRFRFLLIGVFSLIVAVNAGLLIAKGAVMTEMSLPAQIVFGESYAPTPASAFLSSVSYEYSWEGSGEWSSEQPVKAGVYLARTVTNATVGKNYGTPIRFEILPRQAEFTIGADSVVYGDIPTGCAVSDLVSGQKLVTSDLVFEYESYTAKRTQIDVIPSSVKITDVSGEDYTSCYEITYHGKELEITPRKVSLQADSVEYTYSDTAVHVANDVSDASKAQLARGDTVTVQNKIVGEDAPKNKGNYEIRIEDVEIMHGDEVVTDQYDVTKLSAQLVIHPRQITLGTNDARWEYDGTEHKDDAIVLADGSRLVTGHKVEGENAATLTDAGSRENHIKFVIKDGDGTDVTENYLITSEYGTLEVTRRAVTLETRDDNKVYDGTPLENADIIVEKDRLVAGHRAEGAYPVTLTDAGSIENHIKFVIKDGDGTDVTANYLITPKYGTLEVTKRAITLKTHDGNKEYDGTELKDGAIEFVDGNRLVPGQSVSGRAEVSITNAGSRTNDIEFVIRDGNSGRDVTANYLITPEYGTLTVTKRQITVINKGASKVYDGNPLTCETYETTHYGGADKNGSTDGLLGGDRLTLNGNPKSITNKNQSGTWNENRYNAGDNYEIKTYEDGTLTVEPRKITVMTDSATKEYDGIPLTCTTYQTKYYRTSGDIYGNTAGLVGGDTLTLNGNPKSITNKNQSGTKNSNTYTVNSANYEIDGYEYGDLRITPRQITVINKGASKVYDGNPLTCETYETTHFNGADAFGNSAGLLNGDTLILSTGDYVSITDVSESGTGNANRYYVGDNYHIASYVDEELIITSRSITVTTGSATKEYDGKPLSAKTEDTKVTGGSGLANNQSMRVTFNFEITNVLDSSEGNNRSVVGIFANGGKDVTANYTIEYVYGTLTVEPRKITVTTGSDTKEYDGEPLTCTTYTTKHKDDGAAGLLNGDSLTLQGSAASITDVDESVTGNNRNEYTVGANYVIADYEYGDLKVTQRKIIVINKGATKVYDGDPLTCTEYDTRHAISDGDTRGLIKDDDFLVLQGEPVSITAVRESGEKNENKYEPCNHNYKITRYESDVLTVTKRAIIVETGSKEKVYDGMPLFCEEYTTRYYLDEGDENGNKAGLVKGDTLTITNHTEITNVGTEFNKLEFTLPSDNYDLSATINGMLTVTPAPLKIVLNTPDNVTYGESLTYSQDKNNYESATTLVNGEQMKVGVLFWQGTAQVDPPKLVGTYEIRFDKETTVIYDSSGAEIEKGIDNYNVTVDSTYAEILKKEIKVTCKDETIIYGDSFTAPQYSLDPATLPYEETLTVGFSYSLKGSKSDLPYHVGTYAVEIDLAKCAVSEKGGSPISDGLNNYTLTLEGHPTVTVSAKKIEVELLDLGEIEYGEDIVYPEEADNYRSAEGLEYGDTLQVLVEFDFEKAHPDVGSYPITATGALINGSADTSDYDIEYKNGSLTIVARKIIVTNLGAEKSYDGKKLSNSGYTTASASFEGKEGLLEGDALTLSGELFGFGPDVGEGENNNQYTAGGNYEITDYTNEMLVIKPRTIFIVSADVTWEYDGEDHYAEITEDDLAKSYHLNDLGEREDALVSGHTFEGEGYTKIRYVGKTQNWFKSYKILDAERKEVQSNYEIDKSELGMLEVTPRPIVVTTKSATKEYDGYPLSDGEYDKVEYNGDESKPGLIEGDELTLVGTPVSVTNVWEGEIPNANEYRNSNYEITVIPGTLKVTPRKLTVTIVNHEKKYDCDAVEAGQVVRVSHLASGESLAAVLKFQDEEGNTLTAPFERPFGVGTYTILLDEAKCQIKKDGAVSERGIENYEIKCGEAKLTIRKSHRTVSLHNITAAYGDEIAYGDGDNGFDLDKPLAEFKGVREELSLTGFRLKTVDGQDVSEKIRVGSYVISADASFLSLVGDNLENYEFTFEDGTLTVVPREVEVTLKSFAITYGDSVPEDMNGYESTTSLGYDDTLEVSVRIKDHEADERLIAGEYVIEESEVLVNDDEDTSDYIFTFVEGTLTVEKRNIGDIRLKEPTDKVYGEDVYTYPTGLNNYEGEPNMAWGEKLEVVVAYYLDGVQFDAPKNAGVYDVVLSDLIIYSADGTLLEGGNNNYVWDDIRMRLTVLSKEITVTIESSTYTYGNEAPEIKYSVKGLADDERLTLIGFLYDGATVAPRNAGEYQITSAKEFVLINDSTDGVDNYTIVFGSATLTIEQRHIKVETESASHVYDGEDFSLPFVKAYYADDEDIEGFVYGDQPEIDLQTVPKVRNVKDGRVENNFEFTVSGDYVIDGEITYGEIWITARVLTITPKSDSIVYGDKFGYPEGNGNYARADGLIEGDSFEIFVVLNTEKEIPDVGSYDILVDEEKTLGENDFSNYDVTFDMGVLEITRRKIVIASKDETFEYDGTDHYAASSWDDVESYHLNEEGVRESALVEGHAFVEGDPVCIRNVGWIYNIQYSGNKIQDREGNDVTDNYEIDSEKTGKLIVTPRAIVVVTNSAEKEYNGTALSDKGYKTYLYEDGHDSSGYYGEGSEEGLIEGDKLVLAGAVKSITNVWDSGSNTTTFKSPVDLDEVRYGIAANYTIKLTFYGELVVTPRPITVEIPAQSNEYFNGPGSVETTGITVSNLADGEKIGQYAFYYTNGRDGETLPSTGTFNVGEYWIELNAEACKLYKKGILFPRGMENYTVDCEGTKLTITQREITVTVNDITAVYGDEIVYGGFTPSKPLGIFNGTREDISFTYHFETAGGETVEGRLNVGAYNICIDEDSVELVYGSDLDNYNFTFGKGKLTITQRAVTITTQSAEKTYDGTELKKEDGYTVEGLLDEVEVTLTDWASQVDAGSTDNTCTVTVPNENYYFDGDASNYGTLTVNKATLVVVLKDVEDVDYGKILSYPSEDGNYESATGLVNNEKLDRIKIYFTDENGSLYYPEYNPPMDAGVYYVQINVAGCVVSGSKAGIANYEVKYDPVSATIGKITLKIELNDAELTYNGKQREYSEGYNLLEGELKNADILNIAVTYYDDAGNQLDEAPTDAGEYQIKLDAENCLVNGRTPTSVNYKIEYEDKFYSYVISPAPFTVGLTSLDVVYNGGDHSYTKNNGFAVNGLFGQDEIECNVKYSLNGEEVTSPIINAGEYTVTFDPENIVFLHGNPSNYKFDGSKGDFSVTLKINRRAITVTVNDRSVEYTEAVNPADESYKAEYAADKSLPAFVADDEKKADATFYYMDAEGNRVDGLPKTLTVGEYTIGVEFSGDAMSNYDVTMNEGTLRVTGRNVRVTPVYSGGDFEYNGYPVDVSGKLSFTSVHTRNGAADGGEGFAEEDLKSLIVTYIFIDSLTGNRIDCSEGKGPTNAGSYQISLRIEGYDTDLYEVEIVPANNVLTITRKKVNVETQFGNIEKQYDKQAPEDVEITYSGLVQVDIDKDAKVVVAYYDGDREITAYNVGTYTIGAKISDKTLVRNYEFVYRYGMGTLEITPVTLYIKPIDKTPEYYKGHDLKIGETEYEFVDKTHNGLVQGDTLKITPSTSLDPSRTYASVSIKSYTITDAKGADMSGNYIVYTSYDRSVMGTAYNASSFRGSLKFLIRTVSYRQTAPEGQNLFPYDGNTKLVKGTPANCFTIVEGDGEGECKYLYDRIEASFAEIGPYVGQYSDWLKLVVKNSAGRDVSAVYKLKLVATDEGIVSIKTLDLTLKIDSSLTNEMLESGKAFTTSDLFDGRSELNKQFYTLSGTMPTHSYAVIAIKSSGKWNFAVVVYETKANGSLIDRSDCYKLSVEKESALAIDCKLVACHSLTSIPSDITLKLNVDYEYIKAGAGLTTYDGRPALKSEQYEIKGLLKGHDATQVVIVRSGGKLTLVVLVMSGKSDRSYYYNLIPPEYPADSVNIVLKSSLSEVPQDVTININVEPEAIDSDDLVEFDGRWALKSSLYEADGLLANHSVQIVPVKSGGKICLAALIYEPKSTGGRSDKSYLYNLIVTGVPGDAVKLVSSLNEIHPDVKITLNENVSAEKLLKGEGVTESTVGGDTRRVLEENMFTIENSFGKSPLASSAHKVEIIVDITEDNTVTLYVIVYQISSSDKRSDRSNLYNVSCDGAPEGVTVVIKTLPLGNEGKI